MTSEDAPQKQIGSILSRALAGYTDDYKHIVNGASYVQWGRVQDDINAVVAAALTAATERAAVREQALDDLLGMFFGYSVDTHEVGICTVPKDNRWRIDQARKALADGAEDRNERT